MKIRVTNIDSGQLIKIVDYEWLRECCKGDERMIDDFIRLIRHHPNNRHLRERWEIIEE